MLQLEVRQLIVLHLRPPAESFNKKYVSLQYYTLEYYKIIYTVYFYYNPEYSQL